MRKPLELLGRGDELEQATRACLQGLRTAKHVSCGELLHVIDTNWLACEGLVEHLAGHRAELQDLVHEAQGEVLPQDAGGRELPASEEPHPLCSSATPGAMAEVWTPSAPWAPAMGLFTDLLSTLGIAPEARAAADPAPARHVVEWPRAPEPAPTFLEDDGRARSRTRGLLVDLDAALEQLEHGSERAAQEGARLLSELEDLGRRFEKLRACWPCLRESICRAYEVSKPLETASLAGTLREVLLWRRALAAVFEGAGQACEQLRDGLEQARARRGERARWRTLARGLLGDLEPAMAARAASALWLQGPGAREEPEGGELRATAEAAEALGRNLEPVEALERQLVCCAAVVLRCEGEPMLVQRASRRFARARRRLLAAVEGAALARCRLKAVDEDGDAAVAGLAQAATGALRELLHATDRVSAALEGAPEVAFRGPEAVGPALHVAAADAECFAGPAAAEEVRELHAWVRDVLLAPTATYEDGEEEQEAVAASSQSEEAYGED